MIVAIDDDGTKHGVSADDGATWQEPPLPFPQEDDDDADG